MSEIKAKPLVWRQTGKKSCQKSDEHIQAWLEERQELLILMAELLHLEPFNDECIKFEQALKRFCQILVDYSALGHFEVYSDLYAIIEKNAETKAKVSDISMEGITATTGALVDFSDKYASGSEETEIFRKDLGNLVNILEVRLEIEEVLISLYCKARGDVPDKSTTMKP